MKEKLEKRLKELREEFETGRKMLAEIETKRGDLEQNMLRISGAIQVLEEELKPVRTGEETETEEEKTKDDKQE